jgi:serine/threonine protein kinase
MACIVFELLTGDLMFDPHAGKSWDRDEDHLAMIIELLGSFPKHMTCTGKHAGEFFTKRGELRHIHQLKFWGIKDVLQEKYKFDEEDAEDVAAFLEPILSIDPDKRATAADCLKHPWLTGAPRDPSSRPKREQRDRDYDAKHATNHDSNDSSKSDDDGDDRDQERARQAAASSGWSNWWGGSGSAPAESKGGDYKSDSDRDSK